MSTLSQQLGDIVFGLIEVSFCHNGFCESNSTSPVHGYFSALLAVILGAALAYFYSRRLEKRKAHLLLISEFSNDLRKISELCEIYWLSDHTESARKKELEAVGYQLRSALTATAEYRELIKSLMGSRFADFDSLDTRLTMVATGGNFQTKAMKSSPETFQEIMSLILKTELILRTIRKGF